MKLLTFFVACLCQLGGTEITCEEETGSQNASFVTCVQTRSNCSSEIIQNVIGQNLVTT